MPSGDERQCCSIALEEVPNQTRALWQLSSADDVASVSARRIDACRERNRTIQDSYCCDCFDGLGAASGGEQIAVTALQRMTISDRAPCQLCGGGALRHHISCVRFRHDDDEGTIARRVNASFHVGEALLLRDQALRCFDVTVEFRAADRNVAVVMLHGYSQIVPLTSLRRVGEQT